MLKSFQLISSREEICTSMAPHKPGHSTTLPDNIAALPQCWRLPQKEIELSRAEILPPCPCH
jgi:hypothetical protein